ncbi:hypothetical protein N7492_001481 [Penicillium capsulatum]|uniref:Uncharacterized protein n=1 Tax=Penicillium capsulatum TaxID=69766 RepID=A0A9W9LZX2_9EURO|nr:hypothetical protein N7492_001481 [Penicillium capsulatum]KAJ6129465.1 hypothetical protein N7512_002245 [Penicillium capsulatum]
MVSKRQKPHDLQVPVPTFPLSSPISEEISSPSCSSAEDKELERSRPFDFLVKSTRQKVGSRPEKEGNRSPSLSHRDKHGESSKLSIRGITKKRKVERKPVGLNLVTDFTLSAPPKNHREEAGTAPFVDLNDLKLLSKAREKERTAQKTKSASKKRTLRGFQHLPDEPHHGTFLDTSSDNPFDDRHDHGLSPSDRHVMIGLTVPTHESSERSKELDIAGDLHTPLTPSIIVTPAREDAPWPSDSPEDSKPRATSSVYSQPTPRIWQNEKDIPPVPAIPQEHTGSKNLGKDTELLNAHLHAMTRKRRSMSTGTIIENESPTQRSLSQAALDDNDQTPLNRLSVNTETERPQSQGWWTYLLSPLLGKKSPMSPLFPRESTAVAPSSQGAPKDWWEKETSCFSPDTPETAVTNQWSDESKGLEQSRSLGVDDNSAQVSKQQTTNSMMFPGRPVQGEAAEYYQACAHELFSKTPFFECYNHICSITPASVIAAQADITAHGDRGPALAGVSVQQNDAQTGSGTAAPAPSTTSRGLLIDIDSPNEASKSLGQTKTIASPASARSIDSWPSTAVSENEKTPLEPPQTTSKGISHEPPAQTEPPVPEPAPAQPPAPIPMPVPDHETTPAQPPPAMPAPAYEPAPVQPPVPMPEPAPAPIAPPAPAPAPSPAPAPAPVPIPAAAPQITNNIHYAPPPVSNVPQPAATERAVPHYVPIFPPTNPFATAVQEPQPPADNSKSVSASQDPPQEPEWPKGPLPLATSEPTQVRHVGHNPFEPISPGFQRAAGGPGSIPLSDVNAPAPAYSQYPRDAPLPPRYDLHSAPGAAIMNPTGERGPMESRRRRLEREDAAGRKFGGLWRGRGCFSNKGCFGRPGREGRVRRRWYLAICTFFLVIVVLAIVLATTLTKKGDTTFVQTQWLNLTGYPPMPTGISTIAGSETQVEKSTCIQPSSLWSCALPPDQQFENKPYKADQPNFRIEIRFRNGTYSHGTDPTNKSKRDDSSLFTPKPDTPSAKDQSFLGNTTDGNSQPYAGEETPFYMSVLSAVRLSSTNIYRRSNRDSFPNITNLIPPPVMDADGTASAPVLHPLPESQPVRLYNRGKSDEHYGFYTYFDKSIFLESMAALNGTDEIDPNDKNGGAKKSDAKIRCTWSQSRFLVQIWTQPSKIGRSLISTDGKNSTGSATASASTPTSASSKSSSSATYYDRPGSFPYPITISVDRHGGNESDKLVYCYALTENGHYNVSYKKLQLEDRGAGGKLVNPASGIFKDKDSKKAKSNWNGTDGGTGGCQCQWTNWISTS